MAKSILATARSEADRATGAPDAGNAARASDASSTSRTGDASNASNTSDANHSRNAPAAAAAIAVRLGHWLAATEPGDLPSHVIEFTKTRLLDTLATAYAARELPVPGVARAFAQGNSGSATVVGSARGWAPLDAALINATQINGTTHDDFLAKSHAGAVTVPAALAMAEAHGASGATLLTAIALGYDVGARVYQGGPTMLPRFRASGVTGAIAAAAAAAHAMRLTGEQAGHALGLAAMFASGFGEGFRYGTMDVKFNVGWACRSGVSAAQLASCGATSAPTVFEGPSGFFEAFSNSAEAAGSALAGLGQRWLIEDSVYKERPVCIFVQTPVQLAHDLVTQHAIDPARITRVTIRAPLATSTNPGYQNVAPFGSPLQARISAGFTVAAALLGRPVHTYKYFDQFNDVEVLALAERIELLEPGDDEHVDLEVFCGDQRFASVGVEMDHLRPTLDKTIAKYRRLTAALAPQRAQSLLDTVLELEHAADLHSLTEQLRTL